MDELETLVQALLDIWDETAFTESPEDILLLMETEMGKRFPPYAEEFEGELGLEED